KWAVEQRLHVINVSLGTSLHETMYPLYVLCERARRSGIIVVAAGHNQQDWSYPAIFENVIGVDAASFDSPFTYRYRPDEAMECLAWGLDVPVRWLGGRHVPRTGTSFAATIFILSLAAHAPAVLAADTVKIVVPYPPGGSSDAAGRLLAEKFKQQTAATVVVENKAGANGNIGTAAVANGPADGSMLLAATDSAITVNPLLYKSPGYDPLELKALGMFATMPSVLLVPADSAIRSVSAFVDEAKKRELTYASGGVGSAGHLTMAYFGNVADLKLLHVPFQGGAPAMVALLGGQVDTGFVALPNALSQVKGGKLRALAVSGAQRSASLPDVPTMIESGFKGFEVQVAYFLFAPSKAPADKLKMWSAELSTAASAKEFQARLSELGLEPQVKDAEGATTWLVNEKKRWKGVIEKHGISAN
ncbi:MAG: tripartite tricarboxylate transporter substrate-binding protein, partial [Variovorax sp.]